MTLLSAYIPQKSQRNSGNAGSEGVFGTEVGEDTLEQAKARQRKGSLQPKTSGLFQPESWGTDKPYQPSMSEIMAETAEKQYVFESPSALVYFISS